MRTAARARIEATTGGWWVSSRLGRTEQNLGNFVAAKSACVSPPGWPSQDPTYRCVNPLVVAFLRWDPSAGQLLGDSVIRPSVASKSLGHSDDLLFTRVSRQLLARGVSRVEDKTVWYRAGTFTSPDLLLQDLVYTFRNLFPLQLRDGGKNG